MNPLIQSIGVVNTPKNAAMIQRIVSSLQKAGTYGIALQALNAFKSGRLEEYAQQLYQSNAQFRKYADENKGKTLSEIAEGYGINLNQNSG